MKRKLVKVIRCSNCRGEAVVYSDGKAYNLYCFSCGRKAEDIDPLNYRDLMTGAMLAILQKLCPNDDIGTLVPKTVGWRDIQITIFGVLDVNALEQARFRKFFHENYSEEDLQLSFYHLLKTPPVN